jgi:hypothetical protein
MHYEHFYCISTYFLSSKVHDTITSFLVSDTNLGELRPVAETRLPLLAHTTYQGAYLGDGECTHTSTSVCTAARWVGWLQKEHASTRRVVLKILTRLWLQCTCPRDTTHWSERPINWVKVSANILPTNARLADVFLLGVVLCFCSPTLTLLLWSVRDAMAPVVFGHPQPRLQALQAHRCLPCLVAKILRHPKPLTPPMSMRIQ